jgi:hypothetical protein
MRPVVATTPEDFRLTITKRQGRERPTGSSDDQAGRFEEKIKVIAP